MKKKSKQRSSAGTTIILVLVLIAGLSLLLYPTVADKWNERHSTRVISSYSQALEDMSNEELVKEYERAVEYNSHIKDRNNIYVLSDEEREEYESLLDIKGIGIMGYIEVPSLDILLPIYHGTGESALQVGVGHLDWSSLPVGGEGTHCLLSGHRGLPSARLFTDLDKLKEGELFTLTVLDEVLTYEVDRIRIVEPTDITQLQIEKDKDYCTLITCTPYGINTHRLLVRGHRVETEEVHKVRIISEAVMIEPLLVAPIVAFPFLLALLLLVIFGKPRKRSQIDETWEEL